MPKLLHIVGSPRGDRSRSRAIGQAIADAYVARDGHQADTLDVWKMADLPAFDADAMEAKYAVLGGDDFTPEQKTAWDNIATMADKLKSYDVIVVSTPMWNFDLPYKLKHYIDVVTQPGLTFSFDPETGYSGLIPDCKGVAIVSRSQPYEGDAAGLDHQKPYLEQWMGFVGIDRVETIDVSPTVGDPEQINAAVQNAREQATSIGSSI